MTRSRSAAPVAALAVLVLILAACTETADAPSEPTAEATATTTPTASASASEEPSSSPEASESEEAAEEEVTIVRSQFEPTELAIAAGTLVTFTNPETFAHTVTEGTGGQPADDPFVDEEVEAGGSVEAHFHEPGTYEITCRFHPSMQMTVVVEG